MTKPELSALVRCIQTTAACGYAEEGVPDRTQRTSEQNDENARMEKDFAQQISLARGVVDKELARKGLKYDWRD